ncbi:RAxF-45 family protein [Ureibacillus galli]|nr:RAxF-45 family protein [Ureibacillus galli]
MNQLAVTTCVEMNGYHYFARVITFDFAINGISLPFFNEINRKHS